MRHALILFTMHVCTCDASAVRDSVRALGFALVQCAWKGTIMSQRRQPGMSTEGLHDPFK